MNLQAIAGLMTPVAAIGGVWLAGKFTNKESQADRQGKRIDALETRERVRDDYIFQLRQHISEEKGPPPPEWPEELLHS